MRMRTLAPVRRLQQQQHNVQHVPKASALESATYIVGQGVIVFTVMYCSLNYMYYKRLREDIENKKNKK
jgi:hypothetical protein